MYSTADTDLADTVMVHWVSSFRYMSVACPPAMTVMLTYNYARRKSACMGEDESA